MIRDVNLGSGSATLVLLLSGFDFGFMFWRFFTFWEPFAFIGKMHYLILSFQRDSKEWMVLSPMAATIWSKVCVVVYSYWIVCTHSIGYGTGTVVKRFPFPAHFSKSFSKLANHHGCRSFSSYLPFSFLNSFFAHSWQKSQFTTLVLRFFLSETPLEHRLLIQCSGPGSLLWSEFGSAIQYQRSVWLRVLPFNFRVPVVLRKIIEHLLKCGNIEDFNCSVKYFFYRYMSLLILKEKICEEFTFLVPMKRDDPILFK